MKFKNQFIKDYKPTTPSLRHRKILRQPKKNIRIKSSSTSIKNHGFTTSIKNHWNTLITASQLESITLTIKRALKRKGKIIHRVFPHQSLTKKPQEVRMGKGKGNVHQWVQVLKPNSIILELHVSSKAVAKIALKAASNKLPFKTKLIV